MENIHYKNLSLENINGEIWKPISGYEGYFEVSNYGRIKSLKRSFYNCPNKFTKLMIRSNNLNRFGYVKVALYKDSIRKWFTAHRLVAFAFIPNPENKREVNHINGIKTDNRAENLEWCTSQDNQIHAFKFGLQIPTDGERNGQCKLSTEQINEIREKYTGYRGQQQVLAKEYGVRQSHISRIVLNQRRKVS